MAGFSPSDAALEGFRLTKERPATVAAWCGIYLLGFVAVVLAMLATLGQPFIEMLRRNEFGHDGDATAALLMQSSPAFVLVLVITALLMSTIMAGIFRVVLRPEEPGVLHLRLGGDELRLAVVNIILVLVGMVFLAVVLWVTAAASNLGAPAGLVAGLVMAALTLWIGVRLSFVTPMTFDRRRITIGAAWAATRGRFWPLLGMIVLAVIFYLIVWVLIAILSFVLVEILGGQQLLNDISGGGGAALLALGVTIAMQMLLQVLQLVMIYAPFAVAYGKLRGE